MELEAALAPLDIRLNYSNRRYILRALKLSLNYSIRAEINKAIKQFEEVNYKPKTQIERLVELIYNLVNLDSLEEI